MRFLDSMPGFRSKKIINTIIATIYYTFFIGVILGLADFKMTLIYGAYLFIPYIILESVRTIKEIIKKEVNFNFKSKLNLLFIGLVICSFSINNENTLVTRSELKNYKSLDKKIENLYEEDSKYYNENYDEISKYLDLRVKYEGVVEKFNKYKEEYPEDLVEKIKNTEDEINKNYKKVITLENELKEAKEEKRQNQIASSSNSSQLSNSNASSSNNNYNNGSSNNNNSSSSNSNNSNNNDNNSSNKHIGRRVYVANGNSYYHAISNCKYLEGAPTSVVTLTSGMRKYECNCWTNPVIYRPSSNSNSSSGGSSTSGGKIVYIASGNSYYHKSSSCKFLRGASAKAVSLSNVGGKHPCNCVKY